MTMDKPETQLGPQHTLKEGLKKFGEKGKGATKKEVKQQHD